MVFSELYSVYYNTVAKIIKTANNPNITERELQRCVVNEAFSESVFTILPSLKSGKWPLLNDDLSPVLKHIPTMPLTILEKRWLKAIFDDPRIKLFDIELPELENIEPLFTKEDFKIYDQYSDGDPFEDEKYKKHFQILLSAIKQKRPVCINMLNRHGKEVCFRFFPKGLEYSVKDDKIRIVADGCMFSHFNLGRVLFCDFYNGDEPFCETPRAETLKELTILITDERNALERAMLHFAHLEKQAERLDDNKYLLRLKYYENDETEIVIRVLSFGQYLKVVEPQSFVNLIKARLIAQRNCEL